MKLAAGIITYNDGPGLERCIESIYEGIDRIFVVDGRYPDYGKPTDSFYSNDDTLDIVSKYGHDKIIYLPVYADQNTKRTKYLEMCKYHKCDFLLVIDADEYIASVSWKLFKENIQRYILGIPELHRCYLYPINFRFEPDRSGYLHRLIYKPYELHYIRHWILAKLPNLGNVTAVMSHQAIGGIIIATDDLLRPESRLQQDIDYQWYLFKQEHVITEAEYYDPKAKKKFADHIIWEADLWKEQP